MGFDGIGLDLVEPIVSFFYENVVFILPYGFGVLAIIVGLGVVVRLLHHIFH